MSGEGEADFWTGGVKGDAYSNAEHTEAVGGDTSRMAVRNFMGGDSGTVDSGTGRSCMSGNDSCCMSGNDSLLYEW